jgi:isopentenyl-diphosphate delta-isomerase
MMDPQSGLKWSPWFRIIARNPQLLPRWWADLHSTLNTDAMVDLSTIHRVL